MIADVAHIGRAKQSVADGVDERVAVGMAERALGVRNLNAANNHFSALGELMDIESESYSNLHSGNF